MTYPFHSDFDEVFSRFIAEISSFAFTMWRLLSLLTTVNALMIPSPGTVPSLSTRVPVGATMITPAPPAGFVWAETADTPATVTSAPAEVVDTGRKVMWTPNPDLVEATAMRRFQRTYRICMRGALKT